MSDADAKEYLDQEIQRASSQRKYDMIVALMQSPVWTEVIVPMCQDRMRRHIILLRDRSEERKSKAPDEYLHGRWDEAEAFLKHMFDLVKFHEEEEMASKIEDQQQANLRMLATFGRFSPVTSAPPVDPRKR